MVLIKKIYSLRFLKYFKIILLFQQIVELIESPLENKKYRAITNDGSKHYDFGLKGSKTYLDHQN